MKKYIIIPIFIFLISSMHQAKAYSFDDWVSEFKIEAMDKGISEKVFDRAFEDIEYNEKIIKLDRRQTEFTLTFWEYLDRMVNNAKVNTGRNLHKKHLKLLKKIERKYGVPSNYIVAFWGLESNFGIHFGGFNVIEALATLAYDPRRSEFFTRELLNALKIAQKNKIDPKDMQGSWAGAMGHFQFMPSTYMAYAVDFDKDGKKDIWNSLPDAFASAANYLSKVGWKRGEKWGREVTLPDNLSWVKLTSNLTRTVGEWKEAEIKPADRKSMIGNDLEATMVFPGGHKAPVFLVYNNFDAIMDWNKSVLYAIAVGHFADRVIGGGKLKTKRQKLYSPTKSDIRTAQEQLIELDYYDGKVDGRVGPATRQGLRDAQRDFNLPMDGYVSPILIKRMQKFIDEEEENSFFFF